MDRIHRLLGVNQSKSYLSLSKSTEFKQNRKFSEKEYSSTKKKGHPKVVPRNDSPLNFISSPDKHRNETDVKIMQIKMREFSEMQDEYENDIKSKNREIKQLKDDKYCILDENHRLKNKLSNQEEISVHAQENVIEENFKSHQDLIIRLEDRMKKIQIENQELSKENLELTETISNQTKKYKKFEGELENQKSLLKSYEKAKYQMGESEFESKNQLVKSYSFRDVFRRS